MNNKTCFCLKASISCLGHKIIIKKWTQWFSYVFRNDLFYTPQLDINVRHHRHYMLKHFILLSLQIFILFIFISLILCLSRCPIMLLTNFSMFLRWHLKYYIDICTYFWKFLKIKLVYILIFLTDKWFLLFYLIQ